MTLKKKKKKKKDEKWNPIVSVIITIIRRFNFPTFPSFPPAVYVQKLSVNRIVNRSIKIGLAGRQWSVVVVDVESSLARISAIIFQFVLAPISRPFLRADHTPSLFLFRGRKKEEKKPETLTPPIHSNRRIASNWTPSLPSRNSHTLNPHCSSVGSSVRYPTDRRCAITRASK